MNSWCKVTTFPAIKGYLFLQNKMKKAVNSIYTLETTCGQGEK